MADHYIKRSISTILRENRELWTVHQQFCWYCTSYNGLYGKPPPNRVSFKASGIRKGGMSSVKENDRVGKSVSKNDPKWLTDAFYGGWRKVEKRSGFVIYCSFTVVLSFTVHLYQLKGMQNSKLGRVCERGTICQQKIYERSTFSSKNSI